LAAAAHAAQLKHSASSSLFGPLRPQKAGGEQVGEWPISPLTVGGSPHGVRKFFPRAARPQGSLERRAVSALLAELARVGGASWEKGSPAGAGVSAGGRVEW